MLALVLACVLGVAQPQTAQPEGALSGQVEYRKALNELRAKVPGPNAWDALMEVRTLLHEVSGKVPGPNGENQGGTSIGARFQMKVLTQESMLEHRGLSNWPSNAESER